MAKISDVLYARSSDGIDIAYGVVGDGPMDLVFVSGFVSHLDLLSDVPFYGLVVDDLARFSRVILFDKRGTGLSDRSLGFGSVADRMDDIRAVMDAAQVEQAALVGVSEGGPLSIAFAATYPQRVTKLALWGSMACVLEAPDYPIGLPAEVAEQLIGFMSSKWGTGRVLRLAIQNIPEEATPIVARYERNACTPSMVEGIMRANFTIDVRDILSAVTVPTLVTHNTGDPVVPVAFGRYLAEHIPGAQLLEIPGDYHGNWNFPGFPAPFVEFLSGEARAPSADRVLATVLFTDIVSSTETSARLGDTRWRELLDRHDELARARVDRYQGRTVKTTGDGLLATFDGPGRAITCAHEIAEATRPFGLELRAGLHTGEVERRGDDITGLGVVIARRICDLARSGELLASRTVRDLVTGAGISFADRGTHTLKGVPEDWQLYAVSG